MAWRFPHPFNPAPTQHPRTSVEPWLRVIAAIGRADENGGGDAYGDAADQIEEIAKAELRRRGVET